MRKKSQKNKGLSSSKNWKFYVLFIIIPISLVTCSLFGAYLYKTNGPSSNQTKHGIELGLIYLRLDKAKEAVKVFENELVKHPEDANIYYYLGVAYTNLKELEKAKSHLNKSLEIQPHNLDASLFLANVTLLEALELKKSSEEEAIVKNKLSEAESICREILEKSPELIKAYICLGKVHQAMGFTEKAILDYKKALTINNESLLIHSELINLYKQTGKLDLLKEHCNETLELDNTFMPAHIELIQLYIQQGNLDLAEKQCNMVLSDIEPDNYNVQSLLCSVYERQGKHNESVTVLQSILKKNPDDVATHIKLGLLYLKLGKYDETLHEVEQVYKANLASMPPVIYFIKGSAQLEKKDYENAEKNIAEYLEFGETFKGYFNMARIKYAMGNYNECIYYCKSGLKLNPTNVKLRSILGETYLQKNMLKNAIDEFTTIINTNFDFLPAYLSLADIMNKIKQPATAALLYKAVLNRDPNLVKARIGLGQSYILLGKNEDAIIEFNNIEKNYAIDKLDMYIDLAKSYLTMGNNDKAEEMITIALNQEPNNVNMYITITKLYMAFNKFDKAKETIEKVYSLKQENPIVSSLMAKIHVIEDDISKAIIQLKLAMDNNPKSIESYDLGILYFDIGDYDNSIEVYKKGIKNFPNNFILRCNLSAAYVAKKEYGHAKEASIQALKIYPDGIGSRLCLINALIAMQDFRNAKEKLQKMNKMSDIQKNNYENLIEFCDNNKDLSTDIAFHISRATAFNNNRWFNRALKEYDEMAKIVPSSTFTYNERADILLQIGQTEKAVENIKMMIELDTESPYAYNKLASIYKNEKKFDDAEKLYRKVIELAPDNITAHLNLGMILQSKNMINESIEVYKNIIELKLPSVKAYNNLAWIYATNMQDKLEEALKLAEKAKELSPKSSSVADTLGWTYHLTGLYDKAIPELETAVKVAPWDPTMRYHLGMSYYEKGLRDQALDEMNRALTISDTFPEAKKAKELRQKILM